MLIFLDKRLAFLATPKTGTTAVEMALRPHAEVIFAKGRKHLTAQRYHNRVAPFLATTFDVQPETLAVMRNPEEQIRSWYRYRSGPRQKGSARSTQGLSFDDFVMVVIAENPPPFAGIGSQFNFLTSDSGDLLVRHLFAYEHQPKFRAFMDHRLGKEITIKQKNVSPPTPAPLSDSVRAKLRAARAAEFALYDKLIEAGGYMESPGIA